MARLGDAISAATVKKDVAIPIEGEPDFLRKLYFENLDLVRTTPTAEEKKLVPELVEIMDQMKESFSGADWQLFDEYSGKELERASLERERAFKDGVRFATQVMLAGTMKKEEL